MFQRTARRRTVAVIAAVALGLTVALAPNGSSRIARQEADPVPPSDVVFVPGCCEGIAQTQIHELDAALRDGAWRDAEWWPLEIWVNGERAPLHGELPAAPERGGVAASIRVRTVRGVEVDVMGVDTTPERARRVHEQVQAGEFGQAVTHATVGGCRYGIGRDAIPALLDELARGGVPRVPTRLRPDYTFGADWPALQQYDAMWLVSWRKGDRGQPRLLLAVEPIRDRALENAADCLEQLR